MSIRIPFSKRQKQASNAGKPPVYQYTTVPDVLRNQVVLILRGALGTELFTERNYLYGSQASAALILWDHIFQKTRRELGTFKLHEQGNEPDLQVGNFLLACNCDNFIDVVEESLLTLDRYARNVDEERRRLSGMVDDVDVAINEVNFRFQEHCFGYVYVKEAGEIVRIDSQYIHKSAVEKSFSLLHVPGFEGAENEFQEAHKKYREGSYKDSMVDALKAFESTIKSICRKRDWRCSETANASDLIKVVFEKQLVASNQQSFFGALKTLLESGLPTLRNKRAGHGQGSAIVELPQHVASFALHLAASSIVLLVEAEKRLP